jgi:hypothetical protein
MQETINIIRTFENFKMVFGVPLAERVKTQHAKEQDVRQMLLNGPMTSFRLKGMRIILQRKVEITYVGMQHNSSLDIYFNVTQNGMTMIRFKIVTRIWDHITNEKNHGLAAGSSQSLVELGR